MELPENTFKVEASFRKRKVQSFLDDLMKLCIEHNVSIAGTEVSFHGWDGFDKLEVDSEGASLYWPRIQTDIVVRQKKGE